MRVKAIPNVVGAFEAFPEDLEKSLEELEIRGRIKTIQTTALLRLVRILWRVLDTRGDFLSLGPQRKTISERWCKKLAKSKMIIVALGIVTKELVQGLKRTSGDRPNYSIVEIGQNTKKSLADDLLSLSFSWKTNS